jgi:hypothetical protein
MADDLTKKIMDELSRHARLIEEELTISKEEVTKELVANLKMSSPQRKGGQGQYSKSWRIKRSGNTNIVYNKEYQLTHLLEHGHVTRNGGRTEAKVHIAPAEEKAVNEFLKRIERAIKNG